MRPAREPNFPHIYLHESPRHSRAGGAETRDWLETLGIDNIIKDYIGWSQEAHNADQKVKLW